MKPLYPRNVKVPSRVKGKYSEGDCTQLLPVSSRVNYDAGKYAKKHSYETVHNGNNSSIAQKKGRVGLRSVASQTEMQYDKRDIGIQGAGDFYIENVLFRLPYTSGKEEFNITYLREKLERDIRSFVDVRDIAETVCSYAKELIFSTTVDPAVKAMLSKYVSKIEQFLQLTAASGRDVSLSIDISPTSHTKEAKIVRNMVRGMHKIGMCVFRRYLDVMVRTYPPEQAKSMLYTINRQFQRWLQCFTNIESEEYEEKWHLFNVEYNNCLRKIQQTGKGNTHWG